MAQHGESMANPWQKHGKRTAKAWQSTAKAWQNGGLRGESMANESMAKKHGKRMTKAWQTHGKRMAATRTRFAR